MKPFVIFIALLSTLFVGCEKPPMQEPSSTRVERGELTESTKTKSEQVQETVLFQPFYVFLSKGSRQNHYVPSGFMPNGKCILFSDSWQENCQAGKTCIKVNYDVECSRNDQKWAGIYWLNPANNWGSRKGGFNLTGARKLSFWARGENGGEQIQEFTVGGITGDYPDTDTAVIGPVILGSKWKEYMIDLRGKDLSYISGGFAWTTSEDVNPGDCTFYLDNIRFE